MAVPAIRHIATRNKPTMGAQIDFSHPLSKGLVFCAMFNHGAGGIVYDLLGNPNHKLVTSGSVVTWAAGMDNGPATNLSGTGFWVATAPPDSSFLGPITIVFRGKLNAINAALCIKHVSNGAYETPFNFASTSPSNLYFVRANTTGHRPWTSPNDGAVIGTQSTWAVSSPDGLIETSPVFYSNGLRLGAPTGALTFTGNCTGTASDIRIGRRPDETNQLDGNVDYVLIYNRALTDSEHRWLAAEPYSFMVAISPYRRFFISVGAVLDLSRYRWRDDDNNEALASYLAAENTAVSRAKEQNVRLRVQIDADGDPSSQQYKLQYRRSGNTEWIDVEP